ncbi:hypothetical protein [Leisingera sp. S232]|uniref:hypothetical protein n=1 Tax=Leisingera sp. S232 TaxID=3415132 RepID=UPI003C7EA3A1
MKDLKSDSPFVLALTIVKSKQDLGDGIAASDDVLICVRNEDINETHPNVISVPTQRIPAVLAEKIIAAGAEEGSSGSTTIYRGQAASSKSANGHSEIIYAVESLLAGKLGLADAIERGDFSFTARLAGNQIGTANHPEFHGTDRPDHEDLQMMNIMVRVDRGAELLGEPTVSYDHVKWVSIDKFRTMWSNGKQPTDVGFTGEESFRLCIHGLCISSSADVLAVI